MMQKKKQVPTCTLYALRTDRSPKGSAGGGCKSRCWRLEHWLGAVMGGCEDDGSLQPNTACIVRILCSIER